MLDDLQLFGAPPEVMARVKQAQEQNPFEVWPENEPVVKWFMALATQWRIYVVPMTARVLYAGLDYTAALAIAPACGIIDAGKALLDLQIMERAAMEVLNRD